MRSSLDRLQDELRVAGARWNAGTTTPATLRSDQRRRQLDYNPGPDELRRRDATARAARAHRERSGSVHAAYDLRAIGGHSFVGPVRDQADSPDGPAFATLSAVEATLRVVTGTSALEIERADTLLASAGPWTSSWWSIAAFELQRRPGGVDTVRVAESPATTSGVLRVLRWRELHSLDAMKRWITDHGPLVTVFAVHEDFYAYLSGVYHHVTGAFEGGHCVAIIGFDDGGEYWIAQNSWGDVWGEGGFFRIAYGEGGIDASMWGVELEASGA